MLGIYQIKNTVNGKSYIGSSVDIKRRKKEHKGRLRNNSHENQHLQGAWNKYGEDAFEFSIVYGVGTVEELIPHEQWCVDIMLPEYNIGTRCVSAPFLGRKHTEESKKKMGRWTGKEHWNYGKHLPKDHRAKISQANSGENNYSSKLTSEQVKFARFLRNAWSTSSRKLAKYFGISNTQMQRIITNNSWKEISL